MTSLQVAYITPLFSPGDPLVCRSIALRPSLWTVFFSILQDWGQTNQWYQDDPTHATPEAVITEIIDATDRAVLGRCLLIGEVIDYPVNDPPAWLLPCDGTVYLGSDYPELWAVIHDDLKTDGTHFRTPQRTRRVAWGEAVGAQEGEETHALTGPEGPEHSHSYNEPSGEFLALTGEQPTVLLINPFGTTGNAGSGTPHNNIQPMEGTKFYIIAATPGAV